MAIGAFVLGHSGSGKSFSLKNLDQNSVGLINVRGKPMPFKGGNFRQVITDNPQKICDLLIKSTASIMIIDDFQYIMANELHRTKDIKGYEKYTQMASNIIDIMNVINYRMKPYQRVYVCDTPLESYCTLTNKPLETTKCCYTEQKELEYYCEEEEKNCKKVS